MNSVAVVIPGIMGSELRLGDEVIWPGSIASLALPYRRMADLMRAHLLATDVLRSYALFDVYGSLLDDLTVCGFDESAQPPTLYAFAYDWRKSNVVSAGMLADLLDRIHQEYQSQLEVVLVAHSMGGLVSRYFLESGDFADRAGFATVKTLITIGTPHRGAPMALAAAMGMEKRLFLSASQVLQIASDPRYPALYQLLPPPAEPFAWDELDDSRLAPLDICDAGTAQGLGLIQENLGTALGFRSKLDLTKRPAGVRYFFFYGTRQKTTTHMHLYQTGSAYRARKVEVDDGGDGTVPVWSSHAAGVQGLALGGEHMTLFRGADFRRTMASILGCAGVLAPEAPAAVAWEVTVAPRVVEPGNPLRVTLEFPGGTSSVEGSVGFTRELDSTGKASAAVSVGRPAAVRYGGAATNCIRVVLDAPQFPGHYRVTFLDAASQPVGSDHIIVQQPP